LLALANGDIVYNQFPSHYDPSRSTQKKMLISKVDFYIMFYSVHRSWIKFWCFTKASKLLFGNRDGHRFENERYFPKRTKLVDEESKEMLQFGLYMIFDKYISFYWFNLPRSIKVFNEKPCCSL